MPLYTLCHSVKGSRPAPRDVSHPSSDSPSPLLQERSAEDLACTGPTDGDLLLLPARLWLCFDGVFCGKDKCGGQMYVLVELLSIDFTFITKW